MTELTDKQIAQYLHRSYTAVDGLWFMKVEEKYGFEDALEIDKAVWKILPKIQARTMKAMTNLCCGIDALRECFSKKLALDGLEFQIVNDAEGFRIFISRCPWHEAMMKSGRKHISEKVGSTICNTEYPVWASEFGEINFELNAQICKGAERCVLRFWK